MRLTAVDTSSLTMTKTTDYCGNVIYENGQLKRILTENGYIENNTYYFYSKDHLGNVRWVGSENGEVVQYTDYYPYGLPFTGNEGQNAQPYKFGGKEYDTMHGLNMYDFHARGFDGMQFTTVDPLCEKYYWISPYAYCLNNPVNAIDPDGRDVYKLGFSYSMNSGVFGLSLKILGIGLGATVSPGAVKQELGFYISYDSDNRSVGVGTTYTKTTIDSGNSVTVGPYKHSESNEKAEVRDANTTDGYTKTVDKSLTKSESGGIGVIETTEKKGVATTGVSVSGEISAGLVGVGAKIGITVEPSSSTKPTQNKPAASSSTPSSTPAPGTAPLRPKVNIPD